MNDYDQEPATFLIVDGHALIYRVFHAFPPLLDLEGNLVNALYGFLRTLLSVMRQVQPQCWLVAFDHPAPTKRKLEYSFYKANRKQMPDELQPQIPLIEEAVTALGAPQMKVAGIEADDIIGTISREVSARHQANVLILTGDRDSFQLVDDRVHVLVPNLGRSREKGKKEPLIEYNSALVKQKMQVPPDRIIDFKALAGDTSDNVSGVPGIGAKTAIELLHKFDSLDGVYRAMDEERYDDLRANVVQKLLAGREAAYVSQKLVTIDRLVPDLNFNYEACQVTGYNRSAMIELLQHYGFHSLIKLLPPDEFDAGLHQALF
jgi:DNA polymerase-1